VAGEPLPRELGTGGAGIGGPGGEPVVGEPVIGGRGIALLGGDPGGGDPGGGEPVGGGQIGVLGGENAGTEGQAFADASAASLGQVGDPAVGQGLAAGDASGAEVMGGPGFMPMGGGAQRGNEREHSTWLTEDSDVWGDDAVMTPSVIT
jgi:hypothetical protein